MIGDRAFAAKFYLVSAIWLLSIPDSANGIYFSCFPAAPAKAKPAEAPAATAPKAEPAASAVPPPPAASIPTQMPPVPSPSQPLTSKPGKPLAPTCVYVGEQHLILCHVPSQSKTNYGSEQAPLAAL